MGTIRMSIRLALLGLWLVSLILFLAPPLQMMVFFWDQTGQQRQKILQIHMAAAAKIVGLHIYVRGERPCSLSGNLLLVANHISYLDIIALGSLLPISFMAKQEVSSWPLLGQIAKWAGAIFVDRDNPFARLKALFRLQSELHKRSFCIFPEGTTTASLKPLFARWHRGNAAVARRPGVPIYVAGLYYREHEHLAWTGDAELMPHLCKVLARPKSELYIALQKLPSLEAGENLGSYSNSAWLTCKSMCSLAAHTSLKSSRSSLIYALGDKPNCILKPENLQKRDDISCGFL